MGAIGFVILRLSAFCLFVSVGPLLLSSTALTHSRLSRCLPEYETRSQSGNGAALPESESVSVAGGKKEKKKGGCC